MPYYAHILNSDSHAHIIARQDPITGDSVEENDKVVFCARCKSCFLEDSWLYMNEQHCDQTETLDAVPSMPMRLVAKKNTSQLIAQMFNTGIHLEVVLSFTTVLFFISFFAISFINGNYGKELPFSIAFLIAGVGLVVSSILSSIPKMRFLFGNHPSDVRIMKTYIQLGRQQFSLEYVKQIKYQREIQIEIVDGIREYYIPLEPCLLIYFHSGDFMMHKLPTSQYKTVAKFLKELEKVSYLKELFLYSENKYEYETIQRIQANSNGHIVVGEPARLLHTF
ncbi:hypothetical protein [Bernardetia sp.]|uniref:hypothetical protein n=1 Tax=Bernardetia sp. TaxID=1937974 RepID=UPI0025B8F4CB|nr:hypothetical protein [Bernardetia sp.]